MKLINRVTGDVVRGGLTPADVRALYEAGVGSELTADEDGGAAGGSGGECVPTDVEPEDEPDASGGAGTAQDDDDAFGDLTDEEREALDEALDDMADAENDRSSGDWRGAGEGYEEADDIDVARFERLMNDIAQDSTPMAQRMADRDERIDTLTPWVDATTVRSRLVESGLAGEVEEAFRRLKTADHPEPSDDGDELYVDNYVRHLAGDTMEDEFYLETAQVETGDRAVGVALDMSGSMNERAAKLAMGALFVATNAIGDELVASAYYSDGRTSYEAPPHTDLITGPDEEFDWDHLDSIKTYDLTPTASGIADVLGLLKQTTSRERVLICVTDGMANVRLDGAIGNDQLAVDDAGEMVQTARAEGMRVIGLGVGDAPREMMDDIFGPGGHVHTDFDGFADALVEVYSRQMNAAA